MAELENIRHNISKDLGKLSNFTNQLDITDINRLLHLLTAEFTFFSTSLKALIGLTKLWAIKYKLTIWKNKNHIV